MFKNLSFWSLTPEGYQLTLFIFFSFISYSWFFIYVQHFRNGTTRIGHFIKIIFIIIKYFRSEEVREALINDVVSKYCIPDYMIMDLDSAFISSLMNYLFKRLGIKIKTVAPYNPQSLQAEHNIKSLSDILTKHLTGLGEMWPDYLPFATLAHNTYNSLNLSNYSPYELEFGRKPKLLLDLETDPDMKVSATYKEYYDKLEKRLKYLHKILQDFKTR